jgi:beta-glucuronidase
MLRRAATTFVAVAAFVPLQAVSGVISDAPPPGPPRKAPPPQVLLNHGWRFLADRGDVGVREGWPQGGAAGRPWAPVSIPNDFNPLVSRAGDAGTIGWYEVRFRAPPLTAGRAWNISFEGVRRHATVWLNGSKIGASSDAYAPFSVPARTLYPRGTNVLVVRVDNFRAQDGLPEDWWNWGGIVGPVSLTPSATSLQVSNLGVLGELGCAYRCADVLIRGQLVNAAPRRLAGQLVIQGITPSGRAFRIRHALAALGAGGTRPLALRMAVPKPVSLWSADHPALYKLRVLVRSRGRIEQESTFRVGLRAVKVRGGILYLNGKRLWLHGAAIHEDVQGHGAGLTDADIQTIVSELKAVHANVTRAHYLLSERLLNALDAAGIMVWEQPPVDHADAGLFQPSVRDRALAMLRSTLLFSRSHPSVIVDSVGNELSPSPDDVPATRDYLDRAIALARRVNPTLPVALDIYCYPGFPPQQVYKKLDLLGISSYFGWYPGIPGHSISNFNQLVPFLQLQHSRYPRQALVVSEFGAEGLYYGSANEKGSYAFQANYLRDTLSALGQLPFMNGAIYWTLREFAVGLGWRGGATLPAGSVPNGIHHKGLIAYGGGPKPAFNVAARMLAQPPSYVR